MMVNCHNIPFTHILQGTHIGIVHLAVFHYLGRFPLLCVKFIFKVAILPIGGRLSLGYQDFPLVNLLLDHRRQVGAMIASDYPVFIQKVLQFLHVIIILAHRWNGKVKPCAHAITCNLYIRTIFFNRQRA